MATRYDKPFAATQNESFLETCPDPEPEVESWRSDWEKKVAEATKLQEQELTRCDTVSISLDGDPWIITGHCIQRYIERNDVVATISNAIGSIIRHLKYGQHVVKKGQCADIGALRSETRLLYFEDWLLITSKNVAVTAYRYSRHNTTPVK